MLHFGKKTTSSCFGSTFPRSKNKQPTIQPYTTKTSVLRINNNDHSAVYKNEINLEIFDDNKKTDKNYRNFLSHDKITPINLIDNKQLTNLSNYSDNTNLLTDASNNANNKSTNIDDYKDNNNYKKIIPQNTTTNNLTKQILPAINNFDIEISAKSNNRYCSSKLYKKTLHKIERSENNKSLKTSLHKIVLKTITINNNNHDFVNSSQNNNVDNEKYVNDRQYLTFPNKQFNLNDLSKTKSKHNLFISKRNQISKIKFLYDFGSMDRSVDSIGSCSLDVDADSTDFSGTYFGLAL